MGTKGAFPYWLMSPPEGLTEAERRVLEAYFVSEEVKPAAELLFLTHKTVQNELLLARQRMGETKSWMAAIRYVFHAKRFGQPFVETRLLPKIDRQIKRLIEDYLDSKEEDSKPAASSAVVPHEPVHEAFTSFEIVSVGDASAMPLAQFEIQLAELAEIARPIYEQPKKWDRKRFAIASSLGFALASCAIYLLSRPTEMTEEQAVRELVSAQAAMTSSGPTEATLRECAIATDDLCKVYWPQMYGPKEEHLVTIFTTYRKVVESGAEWASTHDKDLSLSIFGNGHRAFFHGGLLFQQWFPRLQDAIKANEKKSGPLLVRALCGEIYGCLNAGRKAGLPMKQDVAQALEDKDAALLLGILASAQDSFDRANAIRHAGMTMNWVPERRLARCAEAMKIYESLAGERAKWGIAQCLLSIAQSSGVDSLEQERRVVFAYPKVLECDNYFAERECVTEANNCLTNALAIRHSTGFMLQVRTILWDHRTWRTSDDQDREVKMIRACVEIDICDNPSQVPIDIEALLLSQGVSQWDVETAVRLAGYTSEQFRLTKKPPSPQIADLGKRNGKVLPGFVQGRKMSTAQAADLVAHWPPKKPDPKP